nr:variable large family protein [Borreliella mayonii]
MKSAVETITETANKAASGDDTSIGNVVNANAAAAGVADASSVQGIAKGMKAIVDAAEANAGKAAGSKEEKKELLKAASDGNATGTGNANAGHLFSGTNGQGASDAQAQKAAGAINAVSGEQILKEIVDAAEKSGAGAAGAGAAAATNPISAAIGAAQGGAAFAAGNGGMNQNSKVAAAIVLRGMAKDGKFAVTNAAHDNQKDGVKSAVEGDC